MVKRVVWTFTAQWLHTPNILLLELYCAQHEVGAKMVGRQYSRDGTLKRSDMVELYDFAQQVRVTGRWEIGLFLSVMVRYVFFLHSLL